MIDDLRQTADESSFEEEEKRDVYSYKDQAPQRRYFLGMTPAQRFVVATMLFLMTFVVGVFFLLVTEKIYIPGL